MWVSFHLILPTSVCKYLRKENVVLEKFRVGLVMSFSSIVLYAARHGFCDAGARVGSFVETCRDVWKLGDDGILS